MAGRAHAVKEAVLLVVACVTTVGGALAIVGSFLPWATITDARFIDPGSVTYVGGDVSTSVSGFGTAPAAGAAVMLCGSILVLCGLLGICLSDRPRSFFARSMVVGAVGAAVAVWGLVGAKVLLGIDDPGSGWPASTGYEIGAGIYLVLASALAVASANLCAYLIAKQ
jgi:hypothetical protein